MITKPVVFVLGAGASCPYGLPLGETLIRKILDDVLTDYLLQMLKNIGHSEGDCNDFRLRLRLSLRQSIDVFLRDNPDLAEVGKALIAVHLILLEQQKYLYSTQIDDHWVKYLVEILLRDWSPGNGMSFNRLKIITFNYDRSFEYMLYNAFFHASNQ